MFRLEKTKKRFEHYWIINLKLCRPIFNYFKFHVMSHFVYCFWDYGKAVNYDTAYSKAMYNYFLKVFYNKTNKKEYNLQIR